MRYLPLHLDLKERQVLVVGGGELARRKVDLLLKTEAQIHLVAPAIDARLEALLGQAPHRLTRGKYRGSQILGSQVRGAQISDSQTHGSQVRGSQVRGSQIQGAQTSGSPIQGLALVIAATAEPAVNRQVSEDAQASNIPVNVVDAPELCTVTFPAILDRSPLVISVGSSASSPVLTRYVRELIEQVIPAAFANLAKYLAARRPKLQQTLPQGRQVRRQMEDFLDSPGMALAMQRQDAKADDYLFATNPSTIASMSTSMTAPITRGEVYMVGAGPGDPDLLTLKALHLMQKADIVLYDNLVSPGVLERTRRDATREFVGKRSGYPSSKQEDINQLLVRLAKAGHRVLRLKGGDPLIFGRMGEEIEALIKQQIPFQIVPGITAASGCAAAAGIPLTHRDLAQSVRLLMGHPRNGQVDLPWEELTQENETLVFYMGLGGLVTICRQLLAHGRAADTPIAVISKGTRPDQQILKATLETMPGLVARTQIQTPTLIIVGPVVNLS